MNHYRRFRFSVYKGWAFSFSLVLGIALPGFSCRKTALQEPVSAAYIMDQLDSGSNYSLFVSLVKRAGLDGLLDDPGNYAVFAPDNAAFQAAGMGKVSIDSLSPQRASFMVRYLVVPGINLDTLQTIAYNQDQYPVGEFRNLDSLYVSVMQQGGEQYLNGRGTIANGITAANGIIYPIHSFPQIPTGSILQELKALNLNFLIAAINHSDLLPLFSTLQDSVTLMAPTDQAFITAGFPDTLSLIQNGPAMLDSLLQAHIIMLKFYYANGDQVGAYQDYEGGAIQSVIPVNFRMKWIVPGLVHDGHSAFKANNFGGSWYVQRDMYRFTLLQATYCGSSGTGDLGYVSDGSNYSFYRNVFYNADSSTVANVVTPNITAINGLIHIVDQVLPHQDILIGY